MELLVKRKIFTSHSTVGDFFVNGEFFSNTLEDIDRKLTSDTPLFQIQSIKVHGQTAIPTGRYRVVKYFSPKHNNFVPLLVNVPGFEFVEIHSGNKPEDTDGCLLLGTESGTDFVGGSKEAIGKFYSLFFAALDKGEEVWITYE